MSDSENETSETQLKIVIVGECGCGKTNIASRYCHDEFVRQYYPTSGVDFFLKKTMISGSRNVTLQIWDIAGHALSGNMLDKYVFGANIVFLVFDITNVTSFEKLELWLNSVQHFTAMQQCKPSIVVVGNKCDMEHQRQVRPDKQNRFIQENGLVCHLVSARTGEMVSLCFQRSVADHLGIRLSRAEQEEQQPVMKAEIIESAPMETKVVIQTVMSKSSVCSVQ